MMKSEVSLIRNARLKHALAVLAIILTSLVVRAGTSHFMAERLDDAAWFQFGSYENFDKRAQGIIDGSEPVFFLTDRSRTDMIQYPPGFPLLISLIYQITGERSSHAVLSVFWVADAILMPLLILGSAVTAFGWRSGYVAASFAAISPLLAFYGVTPSSDIVTTWFVLGGNWLMLIAARRGDWRLALAAGIVLGIACWFRVNPLFLAGVWAVALAWVAVGPVRKRLGLALTFVLGTGLLIAPIAIRNAVVFREFVLTGLNVGSNLWEGLGETEYGRSRGFEFGDHLMVEQERRELGLPEDFPITPVWPDGIRRDRERARRSLAVMAERPFWYAGVMATRMYWMLKIAGEPGPYYGTAGINCTSSKCLPERFQGGALSVGVGALGMVQSVYRYLAMLLAALGILFALRQNGAMAISMLATVFYYLGPGTFTHTELRYVLPMHAILVVFAGLGFSTLVSFVIERLRGREAPGPLTEAA